MLINIITLSLMAAFYICYFAKMINQRKKGIDTDQLGKGKEGFIKFIEITLKITTYLLPVIQIISIILYKGTYHVSLRIVPEPFTHSGLRKKIIKINLKLYNYPFFGDFHSIYQLVD